MVISMKNFEIERLANAKRAEKAYWKRVASHVDDNLVFTKAILILVITSLLMLSGCMCNAGEIKPKKSERLFPHTWKCRGCGYDNYDGMNHCGICGRKK